MMNNNARRSVAAVGAVATLAGLVAFGVSGAATAQTGAATAPGATAAPSATADPATRDTLTFAREEERMARDLYATIAKMYGDARPFSMITRSEQRHFDAIGTLLARYGVADPSANKSAGQYADKDIQKLYDDWLAAAKKSVKEAYQVGVQLETRDIADLKESIAGNLPADVDAVLEGLLRGSQNHLTAYQRAASGQLVPGSGQGPNAKARPGQRQGMNPGQGMRPGAGQRQDMGPGTGPRQGMGGAPGGGMGRAGQRQDCPLLPAN